MTSTRRQSGETCSGLSEKASSHLFPSLCLPPAQLIFFPLNLRFPFLNTIISSFSLLVKCFLPLLASSFSMPKLLSLWLLPAVQPIDTTWAGQGDLRVWEARRCPAASPALLLVPSRASPFLHTYIPIENLMTSVETLPEKMQMNSFRSFSHTPLPGVLRPAAHPNTTLPLERSRRLRK